MPLFKTSNPALGSKTFEDAARGFGGAIDVTNRMTLNGTVNRTAVLLLCALASASYTWYSFMQTRDAGSVGGLLMLGVFGGFIAALITIFKQSWAPVTAPIYALCEGLFLGGISAIFELRYPGIAIQAVGLTFGTLFTMLVLYATGLIRVSNKLRIGIIAATGGIALFYLLEMILGLFGINFVAVNGSGPIGIAFSLFVCAIAALNLVLDFDFIEQGVNYGAPKYMEWYGAFGIMVTLVWLYLEILRLLSKMRSRN
ncbi:MAG TPA: Bax inhibitor-1/YccA family protein [Terracidiphilus sp.]|jgi:uncharacterized YccA/Bax inhibitor family protein